MAKTKGPPVGEPKKAPDKYSHTFWLKQIEEAKAHDKDWHELGDKIIDRYRDKRDRDVQNRYNILYANTEVLRDVLYQQPPVPEVRRRYLDEDPVGRVAADVLERALTYTVDTGDLDSILRRAVDDLLLPGRGQVRVRYAADIIGEGDAEEVASERIVWDYVPWKLFAMSPTDRWEKVWWAAYGEVLSREDLVKQFPDVGSKVNLDHAPVDNDKLSEYEKSEKSRAIVWRIWCKRTLKVYTVSTGYPDGFLRTEDDPLRLSTFFPFPMPLTGIRTNNSLIPVPFYVQYEDLAEELDVLNDRISHLVEMVKLRGVYDASMKELERLLEAGDGQMIAVENFSAMLEKGGLDAIIATVPIEEIAKVLKYLYEQREQVKQGIYEITGLSDVIRGASQAQETATAQQIKSNYAGIRIKAQQKGVQVFARDLLRIAAEIMGEHFSPETLYKMTNIQLGGEGQPTWEQVMALLKSEELRGFRIDIETDSTIALDKEQEKKNVSEVVEGLGFLWQSLAPAVEQGIMTKETGMTITKAVLRRFDFGKDVEEAFERDIASPPEPKQDDGGAAAEQAKVQGQMAMKKMDNDTQIAIAKGNAAKDMQIAEKKLAHDREMEIVKAFGTLQVPAPDGQMMNPMQFMSQFAQMSMQATQMMEKTIMALDITLQRMEQQQLALIQSIQTPKVVVRGPDGRIAGIQPVETMQ